MWSYFSGVTINVIAGIITSALVPIFSFLSYKFLRRRWQKSVINGDWFGAIFDGEGNICKTDTFTLKLKGEAVSGDILRTYPTDLCARRWDFLGRIHDRSFFAIYWPEDKANISAGCWFLRQVDDRTFDGYYYRRPHDYEEGDPIMSVPMIITRRPFGLHMTRDDILGNGPNRTRARPPAVRRPDGGETVIQFGKKHP